MFRYFRVTKLSSLDIALFSGIKYTNFVYLTGTKWSIQRPSLIHYL